MAAARLTPGTETGLSSGGLTKVGVLYSQTPPPG